MTSFIYFDLGGVVIQDFTATGKWQQLKSDLGVSPAQDADFEREWDRLEAEVCIGRDVETLIPVLKEKFNLNVPPHFSLLKDGFVNRFEANPSIWPIIYIASNKYRVGLLTNMYPGMLSAIQRRGLMPNVNWDVIIDSSVVKAKKPDLQIYQIAQRQAKVPRLEIFFTDDSPRNVSAARDLGWQTFLYNPADLPGSNQRLDKLLNQPT